MKNDLAALAATLLTVGILLAVPAVSGRESGKKPVNPSALLSDDRAGRRDALKRIVVSRGEIAAWQGYDLLATSRDVLDRFWLAKTLQFSREPETYPVVLALLNDPHIPVACRAYHALGNREDRRAVDDIRARLPEIREWYVQLYAYKALRRLGWTQAADSR